MVIFEQNTLIELLERRVLVALLRDLSYPRAQYARDEQGPNAGEGMYEQTRRDAQYDGKEDTVLYYHVGAPVFNDIKSTSR